MKKKHGEIQVHSRYLGRRDGSRCNRLPSRLRRQPLLQQQRYNVSRLVPANSLSANGTLRTLGFVGSGAVLTGDEGFHEAGVAEEVAWGS